MEFTEQELTNIDKIVKSKKDKIFIFTEKRDAYNVIEKCLQDRFNYLDEDIMDGYFMEDIYKEEIEDGEEIYNKGI